MTTNPLLLQDLHPNIMNQKETFQVVRQPVVAVRSQPSTEAQIVPLAALSLMGVPSRTIFNPES